MQKKLPVVDCNYTLWDLNNKYKKIKRKYQSHASATYHRNVFVGSCVVLQFSQANFTRRLRDIFNPQTSSVTLQSGVMVLSSHKHRWFHTKFALENKTKNTWFKAYQNGFPAYLEKCTSRSLLYYILLLLSYNFNIFLWHNKTRNSSTSVWMLHETGLYIKQWRAQA